MLLSVALAVHGIFQSLPLIYITNFTLMALVSVNSQEALLPGYCYSQHYQSLIFQLRSHMKRTVIVGGGLSGFLVVMNLLRMEEGMAQEVILVEKDNIGKLGKAYSTEEDCHLLNVPAGNMSLFCDDKPHFINWLTSNGYEYEDTSFVPRKIFRKYVLSTMEQLLLCKRADIKVEFVRDEAIDIDEDRQLVRLKKGKPLEYDNVILAIGTFSPPPLHLPDPDYLQSEYYYNSAWDERLAGNLLSGQRIFLIGTGLTMVDVVAALHARGYGGEVIALSRRGLLPAEHRSMGVYPSFEEELRGKKGLLEIFKTVRHHLRKADTQGIDWRPVIDSLRKCTPRVWNGLSAGDKRRFIQHVRPYWEVVRHRMPGETAATLQQWKASGQLNILSGRIRQIKAAPGGGMVIMYNERGTRKDRRVHTDLVINCMGLASDFRCLANPFVNNLLKQGTLATDLMGMGLNCRPDGALIDAMGKVSDQLFTMGAPAKGILWETTALPELRVQAQSLARQLMYSDKPTGQLEISL